MVGRCLDAWVGYEQLVSLDLSVLGGDEVVDFGVINSRLGGFRGLRNVRFSVSGDVPLRLGVVEEWGGEFYRVEFDRVIVSLHIFKLL